MSGRAGAVTGFRGCFYSVGMAAVRVRRDGPAAGAAAGLATGLATGLAGALLLTGCTGSEPAADGPTQPAARRVPIRRRRPARRSRARVRARTSPRARPGSPRTTSTRPSRCGRCGTSPARSGPRHGTSPAFRAGRPPGSRASCAALGYDVRRAAVRRARRASRGACRSPRARRSTSSRPCPGFDPDAPHLVVGAHLDTVPQAPGAEDNASGVGVLLAAADGRRRAPDPAARRVGRVRRRGAARRRPTTTTTTARARTSRRCGRPSAARVRGHGLARPGRASAASCRSARPSDSDRDSQQRWLGAAGGRGVPAYRPAGSTAAATTGRSSGTGCRAPASAARRTPPTTRPADVPAVVDRAQLERTGRLVLAWLRCAVTQGRANRPVAVRPHVGEDRRAPPGRRPGAGRTSRPSGRARARRRTSRSPRNVAVSVTPSIVCSMKSMSKTKLPSEWATTALADRLQPLHPVGVAADDEVGAGLDQRAGRPATGPARPRGCTASPQWGSTTTTSTRRVEPAHDAERRGRGRPAGAARCAAASAPTARRGRPASARGVSPIALKPTKPNADALVLEHRGPARPRPGRARRRTARSGWPRSRSTVVEQRRLAEVAGVVVGQRHRVEAERRPARSASREGRRRSRRPVAGGGPSSDSVLSRLPTVRSARGEMPAGRSAQRGAHRASGPRHPAAEHDVADHADGGDRRGALAGGAHRIAVGLEQRVDAPDGRDRAGGVELVRGDELHARREVGPAALEPAYPTLAQVQRRPPQRDRDDERLGGRVLRRAG